MGTCINLFIEKKDHYEWNVVEHDDGELAYIEKNRYLIRLLTGLSSDTPLDIKIKPISGIRGFPEDVSMILKDKYCEEEHCCWGRSCYYFGHSYLMLKEIKNYKYWNRKVEEIDNESIKISNLCSEFYNVIIPKLNEIAEEVGEDNVRIVFCFDN